MTTNAAHVRNIVGYIEKVVDSTYSARFAFASEPSFGANWRVPKGVLSKLLGEPWLTTSGLKDIGRP